MRHDISAVEGKLLNNKLFLVCSLSSMKKEKVKRNSIKNSLLIKRTKKKKPYTFSTDLFSYEKKIKLTTMRKKRRLKFKWLFQKFKKLNRWKETEKKKVKTKEVLKRS